MGQRLVIQVNKGNETIGTVYYHWSAYTISALHRLKELMTSFYSVSLEYIKDDKLKLIRTVENIGGGLSDDDRYEILNLYPNEQFKKDGYCRNDGLVSVTKKGIDTALKWSEGTIIIDIETNDVENFVIWQYEEFQDFLDDFNEEVENYKENEIPEINYDIVDFKLDDIDDVINELMNINWVFKSGDYFYTMIE